MVSDRQASIARAGTAADDIWDTEQTAKFVGHVATHRLGGCFGLMMPRSRREEVGGLRWSVIELETGTLHIRRGRVDAQGSDTIVPTKTERSARGRTLPRERGTELGHKAQCDSIHKKTRSDAGQSGF